MAKDKENKKKPSSKPLGVSGTDIFDGIITEEYNSELSDIKGIKIYDEMRRSDATVRAAISATQLPIRRASWFVKTASEDERDIEVRDFIERALFDEMSITWADFLRQALLMLPFGVMLFEKVYAVKEIDGKNYIIWKKFAPRMPKSITTWETSDGKQGIQQLDSVGNSASIPMEKLLVFVNEIEGENWWGVSLLRAAYKHWYIKTNLERIDSVAHERQGLGVPFVTLPDNHTAADVTKAKNILKNLRAHDQGYLLEYDELAVEFKDMKANTTRDPHKSISYHNREIVLAVLAQFLDLGSNGGGSRALSEDHTSLFLQSLEAIANSFKDVVNKYAIKELVDLNFDNVDVYPELDYSGISRVDVEKLSTAYQRFTQSGGLKATEADDQYIRGLLGLPERTEEDEDVEKEKAENKKIDDELEEIEMSELKLKKKIDQEEISMKIKTRLDSMDMAEQMDYIHNKIETIKDFKKHRQLFSMILIELRERMSMLTWRQFQENNDFEGWRKLTFAEKKVNFKNIQSKMDSLEKSLTSESRTLLTKAKEDYLKRLTPALEKKNTATIKKLELKFISEYTKILNKQMKGAYDFAKSNAAREMGVKPPTSNANVVRSISIGADTIASKQAEQIVSEAKTVLADRMAKGENVPKTIGAMEAAIAKTIEKVTRDTSSIVIAGHINLGRRTVFDKNASKIYALQRSEILDAKTCNFCLSMDERIIELNDPLGKIGTFHSNCRGIWVEILQDEEEKPKITGVPKSIRNRIGDATNELLQPKNPITKKSSAAAKAIKNNKAG